MELVPGNTTVGKTLSESTVRTYKSDHAQYQRYCTEKGTKNPNHTKSILTFLEAVKNGYPKGTLKKPSILRMKLRGITHVTGVKPDDTLVKEFFTRIKS